MSPPDTDDLAESVAWGRAWQAKLAGAGWVGINWPEEYGGRGASPVEVAIFNAEYARSGAPQLVNRVGINLAGPTLLAHGTPEQCRRWLPAIVSAEEIWCQLFSEPGAGSDLSGLVAAPSPIPMPTGQSAATERRRWRRVAGHRPEGVDVVRAVRPLRAVPGAHRARDVGAPRAVAAGRGHGGPRRRHPPPRADHGGGRVQRGLPRRGRRSPPSTWWDRPARAGRWRRRRWPTNAAPTSRSRRKWCTRAT